MNQRYWRLPRKASLSAKEASSGWHRLSWFPQFRVWLSGMLTQKFVRNDDIHNTVKISSSKYISERETQLNKLGTSSYSYIDAETCNMPGSCLNFFQRNFTRDNVDHGRSDAGGSPTLKFRLSSLHFTGLSPKLSVGSVSHLQAGGDSTHEGVVWGGTFVCCISFRPLNKLVCSPPEKWDNLLKTTQFVTGLTKINECRIFRVSEVFKAGHAKTINRNSAVITPT